MSPITRRKLISGELPQPRALVDWLRPIDWRSAMA